MALEIKDVKFTPPLKPEINFDEFKLEESEKELLNQQKGKIAAATALSAATVLLTQALRLRKKFKKAKK